MKFLGADSKSKLKFDHINRSTGSEKEMVRTSDFVSLISSYIKSKLQKYASTMKYIPNFLAFPSEQKKISGTLFQKKWGPRSHTLKAMEEISFFNKV